MSITKKAEYYLVSFRGYQLWGRNMDEIFEQVGRLICKF